MKDWWEITDEGRRSSWFTNRKGFGGYVRASLIKSMGYSEENLDKPVIGVLNSWSEVNPGHCHLRPVAEAVKRGIWKSGGFPLEMNILSLCEPFLNKSSLIYRNLMAMELEEMAESHPFDAIVVLGTCDKNVPAYLMAMASLDLPSIMVTGGSMPPGKFKGERVTCATSYFKYFDELDAGNITEDELKELGDVICPSAGACGMMGTANTMQCLAEALGMTLPGCGTIPAMAAAKLRIAEDSGVQIMELFEKDIKPSMIMNEKSVNNAIMILMAIGGSTNAVIHMIAIARRLGIKLDIDRFDKISNETPFICNVQPSGPYGVTDLDDAGGIPAVMKQLGDLMDTDVLTVTGKTLKENIARSRVKDPDIIRSVEEPIDKTGSLAVVRGNLCPDGAIIKTSAASPELFKHTGPAVVLESFEEGHDKLWSDEADVTENHIIVLRNQGPLGAPGMPELGSIGIPDKVLKKGIRDMIRITDARMSGSAFGTVILHLDPESVLGGPLALVKDGDMIEFDLEKRSLNLLVPEEELEKRRSEMKIEIPMPKRGYMKMYMQHIMQASEGCDFDFL